MVFDQPPNNQNDKSNKIASLRSAITRAEEREDNEAVIAFEAELRAVEKGEIFDREKFALSRIRSKIRPKHRILRDMQALPTTRDDFWKYDGVKAMEADYVSYEFTFQEILEQVGADDFQELIDDRAFNQGRPQRVLDLFGGAYFLEDLRDVSKIVGVRLRNVDQTILNEGRMSPDVREHFIELTSNPKRTVIEGNLYDNKTWGKVKEETKDGNGFDLIVCRPEGPFGNSRTVKNVADVPNEGTAKEEIFVSLLERALKLLSDDGGILFTQIPDLGTKKSTWEDFWKRYVAQKEKEGYEFLFGEDGEVIPTNNAFAVRRYKLN